MNKEKEIIADLIDTGSEITGGVGGAVIGSIAAGPIGAVIGAITGPLITKTFKVIGKDVKDRFLSKREGVRIGATFTYALAKLKNEIDSGVSIRQDDFFIPKDGERAKAEELLEGVLLAAQREYEERKVNFLGNLYANICLKENISSEHASQLIKTATNLSFRQFCMLQLLRSDVSDTLDLRLKFRGFGAQNSLWKGDAIIEVRDLQQRGLLSVRVREKTKEQQEFNDTEYEDNSKPIYLDDIKITDLGMKFCEMLSLQEIEASILKTVNDELKLLID